MVDRVKDGLGKVSRIVFNPPASNHISIPYKIDLKYNFSFVLLLNFLLQENKSIIKDIKIKKNFTRKNKIYKFLRIFFINGL